MKSILGLIASVALGLALIIGGLMLFDTNPRVDAAQSTANTAQTTANAAMVRADEAHNLATMANSKAEAALAAIDRGDPVAIVGIVVGCVALGVFGVMVFVSGERNAQRAHDREMAQLRGGYGHWYELPGANAYYDIQQPVRRLPAPRE